MGVDMMSESHMPEPEMETNKTTIQNLRCLMCGENFESDGPHNRICKKCKSTRQWREG